MTALRQSWWRGAVANSDQTVVGARRRRTDALALAAIAAAREIFGGTSVLSAPAGGSTWSAAILARLDGERWPAPDGV